MPNLFDIPKEPKLLPGAGKFHASASENARESIIGTHIATRRVLGDKHEEMSPNCHTLNFRSVKDIHNREDARQGSWKLFSLPAGNKVFKVGSGKLFGNMKNFFKGAVCAFSKACDCLL